jgi:hemerythrin superfamily protein
MDALQMLREDHRKVKDLFRQFEEAEGGATKKAIFDTIYLELVVHSKIEEEIFYPSVRRQGDGTEMVRQAEEEHALVDQLLNEIVGMDPNDPSYDAKFHVLKDNVEDHIQEEESEILPHAAEVGLARLERLGEKMAQRKAELMESQPRRATTSSRSSGGTARRAGAASRSTSRTMASRSKNGATASRAGTRTTKTKRATIGTRKASPARKRTPATAGGTRSRPAGRRSGSQSGG